MSATVLILSALQFEANAVADALGITRPRPGQVVTTSVAGQTTWMSLVGMGAQRLHALADLSPDLTILAGVAGALDPGLQVGEVVVDGCSAHVCHDIGARPGRITTADHLVGAPAAKAIMFSQSGAAAAAAVDMEGDPVRRWAAARHSRFIGVRGISDRADQAIDPALLDMVNVWGRPIPWRVARTLVRRPALVPQMIGLGRSSAYAVRRAAQAVGRLTQRLAERGLAQIID